MARKPQSEAMRSRDQMVTATWPDRASALRNLKRHKMPERGDDYELRESKAGFWSLVPLESDGADESPPSATQSDGNPANSPDVAEQPAAPQPTPKPGEYVEMLRKAGDPANEATVEASVALNDLSPLPNSEGPYELVLVEGSGPGFPAHNANSTAATVSRRIDVPVLIRDRHGKTVREVNVALLKKAAPSATGEPKAVRAATPIEGLSAEALKLASRPEGVRRPELLALDPKRGWKTALLSIGKRAGLSYHSEKTTDGVVVYWLR